MDPPLLGCHGSGLRVRPATRQKETQRTLTSKSERSESDCCTNSSAFSGTCCQQGYLIRSHLLQDLGLAASSQSQVMDKAAACKVGRGTGHFWYNPFQGSRRGLQGFQVPVMPDNPQVRSTAKGVPKVKGGPQSLASSAKCRAAQSLVYTSMEPQAISVPTISSSPKKGGRRASPGKGTGVGGRCTVADLRSQCEHNSHASSWPLHLLNPNPSMDPCSSLLLHELCTECTNYGAALQRPTYSGMERVGAHTLGP